MANDIRFEIIAETQKAIKAIQKFASVNAKRLGAIRKQFASVAKESSRFADNLKANLASAAITKGLSLIRGSVSGAASGFLELSSAVAEVNSILPKNQKLTDQNRKTFIKFSNEFGGTAAKQAQAFYQIVSAGTTDAAQATTLLNAANKAAVAGVTDVTVAIDGLTSVLNAYGLGVESVDQVSDIFFKTVQLGKTTFEELSSVIGQVAPIARSAGVSFDEVAGSLGFLTSIGLSTAEAATGIRAVLTSIIKPADQAVKKAKELGIEFSAAALSSKGLVGFFQEVKAATRGNAEELGKLFPNVKALGVAAALTGDNFKKFETILNDVKGSAGATSDAFKTIEQSASFQFDALVRELKNLPQLFVAASDESFANAFASIREAVAASIPIIAGFVTVAGLVVAGLAKVAAAAVATASVIADAFGVDIEKGALKYFESLQKVEEAALKVAVAANEIAEQDTNAIQKTAQNNQKRIDLQKKLQEEFKRTLIEGKKASEEEKRLRQEAAQFAASLGASEQVGAKFKRETQLLQIELNAQLAAIQAQEEAKAITDREAEERRLALRLEFDELAAVQAQAQADKLIQIETQKEAALLGVKQLNEFQKLDIEKRVIKERLAAAKEGSKQELALRNRLDQNEKASTQARLKLAGQFFGNLQTLAQGESKELFEIAKAANTANAIVQGALAVQNALAVPPFPLGLALAAVAATQAAVQIKTIQSQKFQKGITEIPPGFDNDTFPALLTSGERVVDAQTNQDLKAFLGENRGIPNDSETNSTSDIAPLLGQILEVLQGQNTEIVVNVGGTELIREVRDGLRAGGSLAV